MRLLQMDWFCLLCLDVASADVLATLPNPMITCCRFESLRQRIRTVSGNVMLNMPSPKVDVANSAPLNCNAALALLLKGASVARFDVPKRLQGGVRVPTGG
ncbi:MAG: hypothetical protein QM784_31365 [Polyangiaceae bacterium]